MTAHIGPHVIVHPGARIDDTCRLLDRCRIGAHATVGGQATIAGTALIAGNTIVNGPVFIDGDTHLYGHTCINGSANIRSDRDHTQTVLGNTTYTLFRTVVGWAATRRHHGTNQTDRVAALTLVDCCAAIANLWAAPITARKLHAAITQQPPSASGHTP